MVKKYRAKFYISPDIDVVFFERETKSFLFYNSGDKVSKSSGVHSYFDTFQEAKECLIDYAKHRIDRDQKSIIRSRNYLKEALEINEHDI